MEVIVYGEPPRTPRVEVYRGDTDLEEAKRVVGGEAVLAIIGDFAARLTVEELERLSQSNGIHVTDTRGQARQRTDNRQDYHAA